MMMMMMMMTMTKLKETYNSYEVKQFNKSRVEKIVLVSVSNECIDHRPEQIEFCNVTIVKLIF